MQLNLRLRATRVLRGYSQSDLGRRLGRCQSWVCQLERGLIEPSDVDIALICRTLQVKPEEVFPVVETVETPRRAEAELTKACRSRERGNYLPWKLLP